MSLFFYSLSLWRQMEWSRFMRRVGKKKRNEREREVKVASNGA